MITPKLVTLPRPVRIGDNVRMLGAADVIRRVVNMSDDLEIGTYRNSADLEKYQVRRWYDVVPSVIEYPSNRARKTNRVVRSFAGYAPVVLFSELTPEQITTREQIRQIRARITRQVAREYPMPKIQTRLENWSSIWANYINARDTFENELVATELNPVLTVYLASFEKA